MAIDEHARHQLYLRLEERLGAEAATTLMEYLPPTGWADVATKRDLDQLRAATRSDLDQLRAATRSDLDQLRALTTSDIERMGDQLRAEFYKALAEQTRTVVFANLGAVAAVGTLAFAAAQLV